MSVESSYTICFTKRNFQAPGHIRRERVRPGNQKHFALYAMFRSGRLGYCHICAWWLTMCQRLSSEGAGIAGSEALEDRLVMPGHRIYRAEASTGLLHESLNS